MHADAMNPPDALLFISHSSEDKAVCLELQQRLEREGFNAYFLDFDPAAGIRPGRRWESELYVALGRCDAVLALDSPRWRASPWCFTEVAFARARDKPVFVLQLSGLPVPPQRSGAAALVDDSQFHALDEIDSPADALLDELRSRGFAAERRLRHDPRRLPYPGLAPFDEGDAAVFFGRQQELRGLLELLGEILVQGEKNLVLIVGPSGSGKSSLLRAGLMPRWRQRRAAHIVGPLTPGRPPVSLLAVAEALPPGEHALIAVDQLDEALGDAQHRDEALIDELAAHAKRPVRAALVVATLRAEFLASAFERLGLTHRRTHVAVIGPLGREDYRRIIEEPARASGGTVEAALVDALLADIWSSGAAQGSGGAAARDETVSADVLPMLAMSLQELWEARELPARMTLARYPPQGLTGAIARRAETLLQASALDEASLDTLRRAFLAMVRIDADGRYARQPLMPEPGSRAAALLARFRRGVLVDGPTPGSLMLAHEALIRTWPTLRQWVTAKEDLSFLQWRGRLALDLRRWEDGRLVGPPNPGLLLHEPLLGEAESWWRRRSAELSPAESQFIESGIALRDHSERLALQRSAEAIQRLQFERDRARQALAHAESLGALLEIGHLAESDPTTAAVLLAEASRRWPRAGVRQLMASLCVDSMCRLRLRFQGRIESLQTSDDGSRLLLATNKLLSVWSGTGEPLLQRGSLWLRAAVLSPDGRYAAFAEAQSISLLTVEGGEVLQLMQTDLDQGLLRFTPDSRSLLVLSPTVFGRLPLDGTPFVAFERPAPHTGSSTWSASDASIGTDGQRIAAIVTRQALLWAGDGRLIGPLGTAPASRVWMLPGSGVLTLPAQRRGRALCFDADGRLAYEAAAMGAGYTNPAGAGVDPQGRSFVSVSFDQVAFWRLAPRTGSTWRARARARGWPESLMPGSEPSPLRELKIAGTEAQAIVWAREQPWFVTGARDGRLRAFEDADDRPSIELQGHRSSVRALAFGLRDEQVFSCDESAEMRSWRLGTRLPIALPATVVGGQGVFSPDGRQFACQDGSAVLLLPLDEVAAGRPATVLGSAPASSVDSLLRFSPDGRRLLALHGGQVVLFERASGDRRTWQTDGETFTRAEFSRDGRRLLLSGHDRLARVYDAEGELIGQIEDEELAHGGALFGSDGRSVATWGYRGDVRLWSLAGRPIATHRFRLHGDIGSRLSARPFVHSQRPLLAVVDARHLRLCSLRRSASHAWPLEGDGDASMAAFEPRSDRFLLVRGQEVQRRSIERGLLGSFKATDGVLRHVELCGRGQIVFTVDFDDIATFWSLQGERLAQLPAECEPGRRTLRPSGNGEWLFVSGRFGDPPTLWPIGPAAFDRRVQALTTVVATPAERERVLHESPTTAHRRWREAELRHGRHAAWLRDWNEEFADG